MKKRSIKMSILIPALAALIVGIIAMVSIVGVLSTTTTNDLTNRLISARINEYANEFSSLSMDTYSVASSLAAITSNIAETAENPRADTIQILKAALESNANIFGIWAIFEPNTFDGKDAAFKNAEYHNPDGRFVPYLFRDGGGITIEPLPTYEDPAYVGAKSTGKPYIADPYSMEMGNKSVVIYAIAIPIVKNGTVIGAVGADITLDLVADIMNRGTILDDGYLFTLSPAGLIATHKSTEYQLQDYRSTWMSSLSAEVDKVSANGGTFEIDTYSDIIGANIHLLGTGIMIGDTGRYWTICGVVPSKTVNASSTSLVVIVIIIGVVLILAVGTLIFFIVNRSLRSLPRLADMANAMAVGDIDSAVMEVDEGPTKNEISLLARAFSNMSKGIREQASILGLIAKGDYSVEVPIRSEADMMNKAIRNMLQQTNRTMFDIRSTASQVTSGSQQIAQAAQNLATGTSEQAATIQEFSATITEIHQKAEDITNLAGVTLDEVNLSGQKMTECTEAMDKMNAAMTDINESSQSISKVIKVIDDIAFQTNILALNAAVEAARAGQHGKGFSVVADEVRNLASKSAEAAKETAALIEGSLQSVSEGASMVSVVNESIQAVGEISARNAETIGRMNTASRDQSEAMEQISIGISQLSSVIQSNSATSEETAASSEEMSAQATVLNNIVAQFKLASESGASVAREIPQMKEDSFVAPPQEPETGFSLAYSGKY